MPLLLSLLLAIAPEPPVKVLIVGVLHMSNPGHGHSALLDAQGAVIEESMQSLQRTLAERGISAALRSLNDPEKVKNDNAFYRNALRIGSGAAQPGVDLLTAWYKRNFLICANLI